MSSYTAVLVLPIHYIIYIHRGSELTGTTEVPHVSHLAVPQLSSALTHPTPSLSPPHTYTHSHTHIGWNISFLFFKRKDSIRRQLFVRLHVHVLQIKDFPVWSRHFISNCSYAHYWAVRSLVCGISEPWDGVLLLFVASECGTRSGTESALRKCPNE